MFTKATAGRSGPPKVGLIRQFMQSFHQGNSQNQKGKVISFLTWAVFMEKSLY